MKRTLTISAAVLSAALAIPATAQQKPMNQTPAAQPSTSVQPSTSTMPSSSTAATRQPGFLQNQDQSDWRASKLIGASVYGPDNNSIGEIDDLILGDDGQVKAAVVGVGGFLGIGQKDVAVPIQAPSPQPKANSSSIDKITVSFTKDELKNAPKFAYYTGPNNAATTGAGTTSRPVGTPMSPPAQPMNPPATRR